MMLLVNNVNTQIANIITGALGAGLLLYVFFIAISLAVFCLFVAVGTWVVKKVWFSDWGGNPSRYR